MNGTFKEKYMPFRNPSWMHSRKYGDEKNFTKLPEGPILNS